MANKLRVGWFRRECRFAVTAKMGLWLLSTAAATAAGSFVEIGDILTANYYANKVVKVNPQTGTQQSLGYFTAPMDLALTPAGELYVGELGGAIKRLTITNAAVTVVNPASSLTSVRGLALNSNGELFVTGRTNTVDVVMRVNPVTGAETLIATGGNLSLPVGIEILDSGDLVVASFFNSSIVKIRVADGVQTVIASGGVWIDHPWGLAVSGDLIYSGHYDSKHVNRISATLGTTSLLGVAPGFPYGMGLDLAGNILVGTVGNAGQQDTLARFSPQGVLLSSFNVGYRQEISGIEVSRFQIGTPSPNHPPVLVPIGDKSVDEGTLLSFVASANDPEVPPQTLTFRLGPGAPSGAVLSPSGTFYWTPAAGDGPGTYPISVIVTDDGIPPLSHTNTFTVTVNDVITGQPIVVRVGDILAAGNDNGSVIQVDPVTGAPRVLGVFTSPTDVALSTNGFLYVTEWAGTVQRLDLSNGQVTLVNTNSAVSDIWGVTLGPSGELYVTSEFTHRVIKLDPITGAETVLSEDGLLAGPSGIALLDSGHLVVASMYNNSLVSVALADGSQTLIISDPMLDMPWGVAVSGTSIFVTCVGSQTIQKVAAGQLQTVGTIAPDSPFGLAIEGNGNLLGGISGAAGNSLARFDPQGTVLDSWASEQIGQLTGIEVATVHIEITNRPPVAVADTIQRYPADGAKVSIAALLANDSDPNGDPFHFVSASPSSANGGTVTLSGDWIYYVPAAGFTNADSFTYSIGDSYGLQSSGTVFVEVTNDLGPSHNMAIASLGDGSLRLQFDGIPGRTYRIEYSESLAPATWQTLGSARANAVGQAEFIDTPPPGAPARYYRSAFP